MPSRRLASALPRPQGEIDPVPHWLFPSTEIGRARNVRIILGSSRFLITHEAQVGAHGPWKAAVPGIARSEPA